MVKYFAELKNNDNLLFKVSWVYFIIIILFNIVLQCLARYISYSIYNLRVDNLYPIEMLRLKIESIINMSHIILIIYHIFSARNSLKENRRFIQNLVIRNKNLIIFFTMSIAIQLIIAGVFSVGSRLNLNSFIMHLNLLIKIIIVLLMIEVLFRKTPYIK